MISNLQLLAGGFSILSAAFAAGAAWVVTMAAPNCSFDRLDYSRADGHVRQLLRDTSGPIAVLLVAACALAALAGHLGAATLSGLAALGFFANQWTLAPRKKGEGAPGVRQRKKSQRIVAVSLSLMYAAVAALSAGLGVFGI